MKYIVKFFVITFFVFYFTHTFAEEKIVFINMDLLLNESKAGKSAQKQLEKHHKSNLDHLMKIQNRLKEEEKDILSKLDINIINNYCIIPLLGIEDINRDERIRFIAGCHGLEALEKKVDENNDSVAFSIFPSQIEDVMRVADNKLTMPPKSTWFDPKPLDGLVAYDFE